MEVDVKKAIKMFFSNSSFEMIYFEAIANSLDAGATHIDIIIRTARGKDIKNLTLEINDNGVGFDDTRFGKFSKLLNVEEQSHKGLGRLVYLCYFDNVAVESVYSNTRKRTFQFTESFKGKGDDILSSIPHTPNGTKLFMSGFSGDRLHKNEYIQPPYLKKAILEYFYPRFYKEAKLNSRDITIDITSYIDDYTFLEKIDTKELPTFSVKSITYPLSLFAGLEMYYNIKETDLRETNIVTGISVDDRTQKLDIVAEENIPAGYDMVFLLVSKSIERSITDGSRQKLTFTDSELTNIKKLFRDAIAEVINAEVPKVAESNREKKERLDKKFPHLQGYLEINSIGYASQSEILKKAQERFFKDQKEILCAEELTEEQFNKSLDLSARSLAEYVLFRQQVIKRMQALSGKNVEADLHNLLVPKYTELKKVNMVEDIYRNNIWVLDDKFMSYNDVLSEAEMSRVIEVITEGEVKDEDKDRPDITILFSTDPNTNGDMLDVVVVELKRLGLTAEKNSIVEFQLDTRTEKLAQFYNRRIQRMWFYGIVDFNPKYEKHLINSHFRPLFSNGSIYFRSQPVYLDIAMTQSVIQNAYIMDFKALVNDANARNETFLKILQHQFKQNAEKK